MGNFGRKQEERPRIRLERGADGRLRRVNGPTDIGDLWAEQKRIRLAEAIEVDQKKAEKKKRKASREVVVNIELPKLRLPKLKVPKLSLLKIPHLKKKHLLVGGIVLALSTTGGMGYVLFASKDTSPKATTSSVLNAANQKPDYHTVLPESKSIEDLGGWARISPLDKDPVFAYVDKVDGVQLNVSQQPLPESLKKDTPSELAKLAEQFNAKEKLTAGDRTVYVGTSIKGPQSAVFVKDDVLILIRSAAKLTNEQWGTYVQSLR